MKITVTDEDIKRGSQNSMSGCPIALAIRRTMGTHAVSVGKDFIGVDKDWYNIDQDTYDFICNFDEFGAEGVKPFEFELDDIVWTKAIGDVPLSLLQKGLKGFKFDENS